METIIILMVVYLVFWVGAFALAKRYISNLIKDVRTEVHSMISLARRYLGSR